MPHWFWPFYPSSFKGLLDLKPDLNILFLFFLYLSQNKWNKLIPTMYCKLVMNAE